jgi:hypothetical protein
MTPVVVSSVEYALHPIRLLLNSYHVHHPGIHVKRDTLLSIASSAELILPISATLQSTERHQGIMGQERCHFQRDS